VNAIGNGEAAGDQHEAQGGRTKDTGQHGQPVYRFRQGLSG